MFRGRPPQPRIQVYRMNSRITIIITTFATITMQCHQHLFRYSITVLLCTTSTLNPARNCALLCKAPGETDAAPPEDCMSTGYRLLMIMVMEGLRFGSLVVDALIIVMQKNLAELRCRPVTGLFKTLDARRVTRIVGSFRGLRPGMLMGGLRLHAPKPRRARFRQSQSFHFDIREFHTVKIR